MPPSPLERLDPWLAEGVSLHAGALTERELCVGIRALSSLYVERRNRGRIAARSTEGRAKRAAFATYYAALHFLTVHHLVDALRRDPRLSPTWPGRIERLLDLGCGTGAAGAALALRIEETGGSKPLIGGVDVSGWALADARRSWRSFGLRGRARRASLPDGTGRPGGATLALAGWSLNELDADARDRLLDWFRSHLAAGGSALVVEPLAGAAAPWWTSWVSELRPLACVDGLLHADVVLPAWIERLDRSSGLDHARLGARWLAGPSTRAPAPEAPC